MENEGHQGRESTREEMVDNQEGGNKEREMQLVVSTLEELPLGQGCTKHSPIYATKQRRPLSPRYGSSYSSQGGSERSLK